jgi:predicted ArsR family transcriptional regulator
MIQSSLPFTDLARPAADPCANRHQHNPLSYEAFESSDRETQRRRVLEAIASARDGTTVDELAEQWGVGQNAISGRFTSLKSQGLIVVRGTRRTRAGCMAGVHYLAGASAR